MLPGTDTTLVMRKYRYILHSGDVLSSDGDFHHISESKLIKCYGLRPSDCVSSYRSQGIINGIHLYPRERGDYAEHLDFIVKETIRNDRLR